MKRVIMISGMLILCWQTLFAQTYAEWFRQKKTQKKYLIEQIAALKAYAGQVNDGYKLIKDGTKLINDIKNGDFNLHYNYFGSLKKVNPRIKGYEKVNDILVMHTQMSRERQEILNIVMDAEFLTSQEKESTRSIFSNMAHAASVDLEQLEMIVTDGEVDMTDDQRLDKIEKLYRSMKSKSSFQKNSARNILASISRQQQEKESLKMLRQLYGTDR